MAVRRGPLTGETLSGTTVSFSLEAYLDAMERYRLRDIEQVVKAVEEGGEVPPELISFFRDFVIVQEVNHPDHDRAVGIGSLAMRIEIATGEVTAQELEAGGIDIDSARHEYELAFGD
jgi:hypothetical protein